MTETLKLNETEIIDSSLCYSPHVLSKDDATNAADAIYT